MVKFKKPQYRCEFFSEKVRRDLKIAVVMIAVWLKSRYGTDLVVTSVLREDSETHSQGRAIDVRVRDWPEGAAEEAEEWINKHFYSGIVRSDGDPMPVAIRHDVGRGDHIHLQVANGRGAQVIVTPNETIFI